MASWTTSVSRASAAPAGSFRCQRGAMKNRWFGGARQASITLYRSSVMQSFEDYHLRIGDVISDTNAPSQTLINEQRFDETEIGARFATVTELTPQQDVSVSSRIDIVADLVTNISYSSMVDYDVFASIYNPGKTALLALWENTKSAEWTPG